MNNKGQIFLLGLMLAILITILALSFAPTAKEFVDDARNETQMDCNNESISSYTQAACVVSDLTMFHFIGGLLFVAGSIIAIKVLR